jgi:hypothetical protein
LACNIAVLCDSVINAPLDWQDMHRYLESNSSDKLGSFADIAAAF